MLCRTPLVAGLLLVGVVASGQQLPVGVFIGEPPDANGFIPAMTKDQQDTYHDLREEYAKQPALKSQFILTDKIDEAALVLSVLSRGQVSRGSQTTTGTVVSGTYVGSSSENTRNQLTMKLAVRGTDFSTELDGTKGLTLISFRNQAKNILKQTAEWVSSNRATLAKVAAVPAK